MTGAIVALLLTIAIEGLVAQLVLRRRCWLESTSIQLTTWPIAQLLYWQTGRLWPIEIGVAIVETALWKLVLPLPLRRAALVSLAANGVTAAIAVVWLATGA